MNNKFTNCFDCGTLLSNSKIKSECPKCEQSTRLIEKYLLLRTNCIKCAKPLWNNNQIENCCTCDIVNS